MKNKILKILGEFQEGLSTEETATEIESLIKENYVEAYDMFEFIAWKDDKVGLRNKNGVYLYWEDHFNIISLYHYWFKNIKDK